MMDSKSKWKGGAAHAEERGEGDSMDHLFSVEFSFYHRDVTARQVKRPELVMTIQA